MKNAIELAKKITYIIDEDCSELLKEYNFHKIFEPITELLKPNKIKNTLIAAIIYGYDNDSKWIDTRVDGITNNKNIIKGLDADLKNDVLTEFVNLRHEPSLECIGNFLDKLPDWRYRHSLLLRNQYTKTMNQQEPDLQILDTDKVATYFVNWGKAMESAKKQMYDSQEMLKDIERDFLSTNHKTESDFGVSFTQKSLEMFEQENLKIDILSWNHFVKYDYLPSLNKKV